jgi:methylphosphotriester-DNA--protein-cysteine methyltransferase
LRPAGEGEKELKMDSEEWKRSKLGVNKFVGDRRWGVVHEWLFKKAECQIGEIPTEALEFFSPDTLEEAEAKGFRPCPHCLPYNQKKK